ncbi:chemotaxis protein CheA [Pseudothauera nasutitermitis]|uniref:Chemotaxis protein CheA n=1 Tax=Pseudothauera nasutitermitis TaxID=2565930 RepID=A0A4S4B2U2_9RHOO|nr:chemotaxis protein CheA [Pseudothauera nasutitermitis]THF66505.1 chemotaxis protein CheA [Pseudothauera nasutitermitis]
MSLDLSQFHQLFFEEAGEHLQNIEAILLRIDPRHAAQEDVAEIFRAAHSIKGSGATFGFEDVAALMHAMEELLDRVRKGELPFDERMVEAGLAACDALRNLLDARRGGPPADAARAREAAARLAALAQGAAPSATAGAVAGKDVGTAWEAVFRLARVVAGSELLVDNMLQELARLGACEVLERPGPLGGDGSWRVRIHGPEDEAGLRAVLELVTDPGELVIRAVDAPPAPTADETPYEEEAEDGSYTLFEPFPQLPADVPAHDEPRPEAVDGDTAPPQEAHAMSRGGADASIRVSVDKVEELANLVGELVITRSILNELAGEMEATELFDRLMNGLGLLERNTRELQSSVMAIRMVPVANVFARFPRLVHDLGARLGKRVRLRLEGEQAELDKSLVERIVDPLTHLVRNALDHGIESPAARRAAGKPEEGELVLRALHQGSYILVEVEDDGAGLSRERILASARARGLPASDALSDAEVWQLIFEPGLSTAETVTEVSGRGVGMDVVKRNIAELGGQVEIRSLPGRGTRIGVRLPLTLAIADGLVVGVGDELYVIPLGFVGETLQAPPEAIGRIGGQPRTLRVQGDYLPVIELGRRFAVPGAHAEWTEGIMVLVEANGARAALLVDTLVDQRQVVIKSLEANFRKVAGFSAATVLGNGKVALILDVAALIDGARAAGLAA